MGVLRNHKHEQFAQELILARRTGATNGQCYTRAGYSATGASAEACAARMLADAKNGVRRRVEELLNRGARRAEVTVESLLLKLEENILGAAKVSQHGAINGAVSLMAQLKGLLVDKVEIGGPGSFSACETTPQLAERLLEDMTADEALALIDTLRAAIIERASDAALPVVQSGPIQVKTASSTSASGDKLSIISV